ncbi:RluA family pseudouridine synthase [Salinisphaera sp. USBA-960]|uniref:RluA family pseudouridine synthase n=1 Tax=Salinisphaera orenii TaxID=856731 RepID=UPI0013A678E0|nr:RluA family pseudouridine synthase [Salifodinibacter halophilus]NNC25910.1 RluA family pseudouridine synthase [Salifodinibacter halophilus]
MQPQVRYIDVAEADAGMRLDNFIRRQFKRVPRSRVYRVIRSGEVRVNRGRGRPSRRLVAGDQVRLPPLRTGDDTGRTAVRPPDAMIERAVAAIQSEAPDHLVIAKPADMPVHAGSGVDFGLIECLRAARPDEYLELAHRLDRGTSGAMLVARSRPTRHELAEALADARARKTYLALVDGIWPNDVTRVDQPLDRNGMVGGEPRVIVDPDNGKSATSVFTVVARSSNATLLEVGLLTGRKHQIRAHAAYFKCPIAGDRRYGDSKRAAAWRQWGLKRPFLHARDMAVPRQSGWLQTHVPLADDLAAVMQRLGLQWE